MPYYYRAKFGGNWTTNKGETEGGGAQCAPLSPNFMMLKTRSHGPICGKNL